MNKRDITHRSPRSWIQIKLDIAEPLIEIAASYLGNLTGYGVEQSNCYKPQAKSDICSLTAYLDEDEHFPQKIEQLRLFLDALHRQNPKYPNIKFSTTSLLEEDWGNSWKKHFKPIHATNRIVVKPSWENYQRKSGEFVLEIDPGLAFGTGMHASTKLSLEFIDELFQQKHNKLSTALDVGTGTGILGLCTALLGCPHVTGIDNDIDARIAAAENVDKNGLEKQMTIIDQDLMDITDTFDLVIANIIHNTLVELAEALTERVSNQGFLILAGILSGKQAENIVETYTSLGLRLTQEKKEEEWSAICFRKC